MIQAPDRGRAGVASFRTRVLVAMMLVVSAVAVSILLFTLRNAQESVRADFAREFQAEVAAIHAGQAVRHAALAERCRELARRPRIHAALEDGALDMLYPNTKDDMADIMEPEGPGPREGAAYALKAHYYRFLDGQGRVIEPSDTRDVGALAPEEIAQLDLGRLPAVAQTGYIVRGSGTESERIDEVIAMPIVSSESGQTISAIVLGFSPPALAGDGADTAAPSGIWLGSYLDLPSLPEAARQALGARLAGTAATSGGDHGSFDFSSAGAAYLVSFQRLNPASLFPAAYEVSALPLAATHAHERRLVWEFVGVAAALLAAAYLASRILSRRLSEPVERLAVDSEENLEHWHRAEAALESTNQELQRSARFSADASHQLKTPVTVLRAGLEGLLASEQLGTQAREEVADLVHQTFRLASVIEDLLLLSRMDAGRLSIQFARVDLSQLIEGLLDDIGAQPDVLNLEIETGIPPGLMITGEKRYAELILQNLLENARKYNRTGGRVEVAAGREGEWIIVNVGNTGPAIPASSQGHIFERFHRGAVGENLPGHGIGLNLARELARLHGGDVKLVSSGDDWTMFEVRFRAAAP